MNTTKKWYQSATIWGVVIATIGALISKFLGVQPADIGIPANPDFDQLKVIADQVVAAKGNLAGIIGAVMTGSGAIVAIYNRVVATAVIK
jgi:hypothetical protein